MSPADAQRLDVFDGEHVVVAHDGTALDAIVALRAATPEGTVFVESTALEGPLVEVRKVT
jgi:anaerobic selenocysteine-containing dehydrogenase